ncbi:ornithine carbamoyltransferase, partial [Rhizobium ruizarguesonis]
MAVPLGSETKDHYLNWARNEGAEIMICHDADRAVAGVDCVVTDNWVSMNQEHRARGHNVIQPYQVNAALMAKAGND